MKDINPTVQIMMLARILQNSCRRDILVGGSLALYLLGELHREPHDIDIVVKTIPALATAKEAGKLKKSDWGLSVNKDVPDGHESMRFESEIPHLWYPKVCVFYVPEAKAHPEEFFGFVFQSIEEIWKAKEYYSKCEDGTKHAIDISSWRSNNGGATV